MASKLVTPPPKEEETDNNREETKKKKKNIPEEVVSILFVPRTPHSELAKMIQKDKQPISKLAGYQIKILERFGTKLVDILRNKGPEYGHPCGREKCHPCKNGDQRMKFHCWDRSVLYRAYCLACKNKGVTTE